MKLVRYFKTRFEFAQAQRRFAETFAKQTNLTRRGSRKQFKTEAKGIFRFAVAMTPPWGGRSAALSYGRNIRVDFAKGKRAGKANILADIKRAFKGSRKRELNSFPEALKFYLSRRNNKNRIIGEPKAKTSGPIITQVRKAILKRQGWVASGWNAAASGMSFSYPSWVSTWGRSLKQNFQANWDSDKAYFKAVNGTNLKDSDYITRRITIAINKQCRVMERKMKWLAEQELKNSLG